MRTKSFETCIVLSTLVAIALEGIVTIVFGSVTAALPWLWIGFWAAISAVFFWRLRAKFVLLGTLLRDAEGATYRGA